MTSNCLGRTLAPAHERPPPRSHSVRPFSVSGKELNMHNIIYLVGLVVVVVAILSFLGLG